MLFNILFLKFGFLIWQDILEIISRGYCSYGILKHLKTVSGTIYKVILD